MAREKSKASGVDWKEVLVGQEDFLQELVRRVVQEVLEAEMEEAVGAGKWERTEGRTGHRSGYYARTLTPGGKASGFPPGLGKPRKASKHQGVSHSAHSAHSAHRAGYGGEALGPFCRT